MPLEVLSVGLSLCAIAISCWTFWFTSMRRGKVMMTRPTQVGLGFREPGSKNQVFVRCLLFSTGKRATVVENMYARVRRGERAQNFSVWVHGEPKDMKRGAGVVVTEEGVSRNFHFLLRQDEPDFEITPGQYDIELFGKILNRPGEVRFASITVEVEQNHLPDSSTNVGIQFDWAPDTRRYVGHISKPPTRTPVLDLIQAPKENSATGKKGSDG